MKIAITSAGRELDSALDPRFGRADGFIIYDTETEQSEYVDNGQNLTLPQGAGIQSAQNISATGAKAVLTGHVGPKAFQALERGNIAVYLDAGATVQEAIDAFKAGRLTPTSGADKDGHW